MRRLLLIILSLTSCVLTAAPGPTKPANGPTAMPAAGPMSAPLSAPIVAPATAPTTTPVTTAAADGAGPAVTRTYPLSGMGGGTVLRLRTTNGIEVVRFGARADELVTRAVLRLRYSYSPALIPGQSHIKVLLNDEVLTVLPVTPENAGKTLTSDIEIDPRVLTDYNALALQFIGHYTDKCEDALHSSLWAEVSGASTLQLTVRPLAVATDLARLPEPFFDLRDSRRLTLPFVFAARPTHATLRAAAVSLPNHEALTAWRGSRFPVTLNQLPHGHAVVFATNTERPAALATLAPFAGPSISVIRNPADPFGLLLLVGGRDAADLKAAADALARGSAAMSGSQIAVAASRTERPRAAYDAPNWVRMDRPVKFGELVEDKQQLQVFGHAPAPVRINLRIPPDLFTWHSRGVPVSLKFRYTPPIRASESRMSMSINDELLASLNLRSSGQGGDSAHLVLPLLENGLLGEGKEVLVPAFKLGSRNQMQYSFSFSYQKEGPCETQIDNVRAMIDADSTIDFSGYPHYAEMPNLGYFASAGFPFSKFADLAQTTVVLPDAPAAQDIEVMLGLLGRVGESTGYPATLVEVTTAGNDTLLKDRDLLVIGAAGQQKLLQRWSAKLPAALDGRTRKISQPVSTASSLFDWLGFGTNPDPQVASSESLSGSGPMALMTGFESPITAGRSVVAVTAGTPQDMLQVLDALADEVTVRSLQGSAAFVSGKRVESMLVGDTYKLGELPWWTLIWFHMSGHPVLLGLMGVLAVLVIAFALWRSLRAIAARRLKVDQR
ncbi:cellulose biosynthesis cyclic di-GMP-binding regulatory protein BcsB [Duganella phyllosphaerae]|uniref:Cyclic di-GMP-binding protein n=1 Tax=Duganella phyllosphaerae TaxID=762836 RepID=A0A1E7X659_9BURK|nr:cellulose biosynthesis cyclic di-GMP-binding regulatory protein BcsB [Duganella phyllosphaerae]OFA08531.1 cyclic di-GMP-binding protein precursor [Duganella phyllosphaerae]